MSYKPNWLNILSQKYFTRTISQFILHGNVSDIVRVEDSDGKISYLKFKDYLFQFVFKKRNIVVGYDRAAGITFRDHEVRKDFTNVFLPNFDLLNGTNYAKNPPGDPAVSFAILEPYFMTRLHQDKKVALIIEYADTLIPAGNSGTYSAQDRAMLVFFQRWAKESLFLNNDMTTIIIAESIIDLNQQVVRNPYVCEIDIPYPDENERLLFIEYFVSIHPKLVEKLEMSIPILAKNTAGLNLVQLKTTLAGIMEGEKIYTFEELSRRKKEIIETEAGGFLEFVETNFNLDSVAGHAMAKKHLRSAATAIKNGRQDVMPMGYLVNGPVGTGKTFMVSCFASDIGIPMVSLKNFRSQWQGVTESNLEKVLKLLKALSPVAVMIDEADAYLGNRNQTGDSGVSSRVFSMIASFMSDTENRGKIIWFLLTARPDLMPIDLKRQGRAEEHIALFYPETIAERKELLAVMLKKTKIKELNPENFEDSFFERLKIVSGADMEAALTRAKFKAASMNLSEVTTQIIIETFEDFLPPSYPEEVELMNYAAVLECTSKELLPLRYKDLGRDEILRRIRRIKARMNGALDTDD